MSVLNFTATIKIFNSNPYVLVSKVRASTLKSGWRKALPVFVRVNGEPKTAWRINMMPIGNGSFYLYLHGDVRKASNTKVGDRVNVECRFDEAYKNGPMHPMPSLFRIALSKNRKAKQAWDSLIPSRQKEILRYFSSLKSATAKEKNLKRAMEVLSGDTGRFMARSWNE
jgi:hypothetical protein